MKLTTKTVSAQSWWGLPSEPQLDARPEGEVEVEVQEEPTPKAPRYVKGTRWEWFALHTADSDLIFRLSVALELKSKQTQRASPAVEWDSLCEMPDGFALRWLSPALIRAGHMWWSRILKKIPRSKTAGWHVQGYHADPGEARPGQQPIPGAMASSTAMVPPPPTATASPRVAGGQALAAPATDSWPKFPVRRLIAGWTGSESAGFGVAAREYKLDKFLGKGSYAKVYRDEVNGQSVAVKCFSAKKGMDAVQEASIAERLCGHPHLCCLLDAVRREDERALLVYAFVGQSLHTLLKDQQLPSHHISKCMSHVLKGLSHMHRLGLCHFDVKPPNILMEAGLEPRFVLIDLGSAVEVGFGVPMKLNWVGTTLWYTSPELLLLDGTKTATGDAWMRSDVWAAGITMAEMCRLDFFKVDSQRRDAPELLKRGIYAALDFSRPAWPRFVRDTVGAIGVDFLMSLLTVAEPLELVTSRPSSASCLRHPFLYPNQLMGAEGPGPVPSFPGDRHTWTIISGYMSVDVLAWLRQDAARLEEWLLMRQRCKGSKSVVAGSMTEVAASASLNALNIKDKLPAPRLRAWLAAFRETNRGPIRRMLAQAQASISHMSDEELGNNGRHFRDSALEAWFLSAAEMHIFEQPGLLEEDAHMDGAASILHMNLTYFGRRTLHCWEGKAGSERHSWGLAPGKVYLGTATGPLHQAVHSFSKSPEETWQGYSLAFNLRCCLFPHDHSRLKNAAPTPRAVFAGLVNAFQAALCEEQWALPSLADCQRYLPAA